ncbi:ATP-binding protein [Phycicoccus sp. Soil802]|uniref:ATP-binding protein n=1 Tax=Phycicoccus sp. Soil802 TaxID=1736414 RepID=UPI00070376DA|nr:ATP-binding protein [Phycicoccus sp. Soil802]
MLAGLEIEANPVRTPVFTQIADQLRFATTFHGAMVVAGDHGTGKRFALATVLSEQELPAHQVVVPPAASPKDLVRLMYEAVHQEDDVFALRDMQDELIDTLSGVPRILVIDGADQLTGQGAEQLHYLHARPQAAWTLVLLGPPETIRAVTVSAGLRGEIIATVEVKHLSGADLHTAVGSLHPIFLLAGADLITLIDQQVCKGRLKNWARFLQAALYVQRQETAAGRDPRPFDVDFTRDVIKHMPDLTPRKRR